MAILFTDPAESAAPKPEVPSTRVVGGIAFAILMIPIWVVTGVTWLSVSLAKPVIAEIADRWAAAGRPLRTEGDWWANQAAYSEGCTQLCDTIAGGDLMYIRLIGLSTVAVWFMAALATMAAWHFRKPIRAGLLVVMLLTLVAYFAPPLLYSETWQALLAIME